MLSALSKNTAMQIIGKALNTLLGLVVIAIMARSLGAAGFGKYTIVVSFLQFIGILTDFGLTMTVGKELGGGRFDSATTLGNILSFRTITSAAAFALAPLISLFFPYSVEIKLGIALTSLAFFASSLSQTFSAVFQVKLKSGLQVMAETSGRLILVLGTWFAAINFLPLSAYLLTLVASSLITCLVTLKTARGLENFSWQINLRVWAELWRLTWPVAFTIMLNLIYFKADTIILSWFRPAVEVGLYGAAYKVLEVLLALPAIIGGLVLPLAAKAKAENNTEEFKKLFQGTFDSLLTAGLAVITGCVILGSELMIFLAGPEFTISGKILGILSFATAIIFLGNATGYFIFALEKQRRMIPIYAGSALFALLGYFIFIPLYSYWGAAWMTVIVETFMTASSIFILSRLGITPSFKRWPKILLATALLAMALSLPISFWGKIITGTIIYLASLWYLKLIPTEIKQIQTETNLKV